MICNQAANQKKHPLREGQALVVGGVTPQAANKREHHHRGGWASNQGTVTPRWPIRGTIHRWKAGT